MVFSKFNLCLNTQIILYICILSDLVVLTEKNDYLVEKFTSAVLTKKSGSTVLVVKPDFVVWRKILFYFTVLGKNPFGKNEIFG